MRQLRVAKNKAKAELAQDLSDLSLNAQMLYLPLRHNAWTCLITIPQFRAIIADCWDKLTSYQPEKDKASGKPYEGDKLPLRKAYAAFCLNLQVKQRYVCPVKAKAIRTAGESVKRPPYHSRNIYSIRNPNLRPWGYLPEHHIFEAVIREFYCDGSFLDEHLDYCERNEGEKRTGVDPLCFEYGLRSIHSPPKA